MWEVYADPAALYSSGLRYIVSISKHVNAAFLQEDTARRHYDRCVSDICDLPTANVRLFRINFDNTLTQLEAFTKGDQS